MCLIFLVLLAEFPVLHRPVAGLQWMKICNTKEESEEQILSTIGPVRLMTDQSA
jgi:hypothetical protein